MIFYLQPLKPPKTTLEEKADIMPRVSSMTKEEKAKKYPLAKEILRPAGFINTEKTTVRELIGKKVVLIDFWTYSCINCQRTTPYLNSWYEKYRDKGFEIIGVHTPEFAFEQEYENVHKAVEQFGIKYPVVLDNEYATWHAYENRYWPRKYIIDIDGFIVYDHIGEGGYGETEIKIQELLEERMAALGMQEVISSDITKPIEISATDSLKPRSPEIYFGASRNLYLGNGKSETRGVQKLDEPTGIKTNILYLVGDWSFEDEFAENICLRQTSLGLESCEAKIIFRYQAQNVYFVVGSENGTKIKIIQDGKLVDEQVVGGHKLYHAIENPEYGEHTLEIIIENPGLRVFTFTFG